MVDKINFFLEENLSCLRAILEFCDGRVKKISVKKEIDLLFQVLILVGCSEFWIQEGTKIKKSELNNNGKVLKILGLPTFNLKEPSFNSKSNILDYQVLLDDKFLGNYSLSEDLIDVHQIEHYCGIFKALGYKVDVTLKS